MRLKALLEKKRELAAQIRQMADKVNAENRDFTAEESAGWTKANEDYNANEAAIGRENRAAEVEASANASQNRPAPFMSSASNGAPAARENDPGLAMAGWFAYQSGRNPEPEQVEAAQRVGLALHARELVIPLAGTDQYNGIRAEFNATPVHERHLLADRIGQRIGAANMTVGTDANGGYLRSPGTLMNRIEINMLTFGAVRQVAETIRTGHGEPLLWPNADDTGNEGEQLAEETSFGSSVAPTIGRQSWGAYKYSSKPVLVSYELIEDSTFNVPVMIFDMLGERLGRITNKRFTTGTGSGQPAGIVTGSTAGVTAASATAISADEILGLIHSVDPAYRAGASFMMHDNVMLAIRKLKDGQSQYLWQPGLQSAAPDRIGGFGLVINNDMASSIATAAKTILFGQLFKYKIRTVNQIRVYRLQERYRDTDQDGFVAFTREDGKVLTAGTAPIKHLVQA